MAIRKINSRSIEDGGVASADFGGSVTSLSNSGNLTFTGTGNRITGDFSNGTIANQVLFQTSTANSGTTLSIIPSGTGTISSFQSYGSSDSANSSVISIGIGTSGTEAVISSFTRGTGTALPLRFNTGGSERLRILTTGEVGIGTSSPVEKLTVSGAVSLNTDLVLKEGTTARGYIFGTSAGLHYRATSSLPHIFQNVGTELMRITSAGFVGIGTTSPAAQLSVTGASAAGSSGTVYFTQNAATNYPTLQIRQQGAGGNTGDIQGLRLEVEGTGAGYSMAVNRYATNYTMLLRNDGPFMVGNSRFSPVGTSNAIPASIYYNEEKLYQLATSSGSFDICTITSAYTYGCLIIECGGTIQYAAADQRSPSNRKVAVTFAVGSITVANLYTPYVGSFGTINFTYVSDGVLKINVTGATTGVGQGNGIAWVKVIGGQTSNGGTVTPLGFTLS